MSDWLPLMLREDGGSDAVRNAFPHAAAMSACPQDVVYHGEGDVWTHTCMVVDRLVGSGVSTLPAERREPLMLAAWLHDVGKPVTTIREWDETEQRERIRQPKHSPVGADMAWRDLVDAGASAEFAMKVHGLIFWHQRPYFMFQQKNMLRRAIAFSCEGIWSDLLRLARADTTGRIAPNIDESLEALDLLEMWLEENRLLDQAWPFASDQARLEFLRDPKRSAYYDPPQPKGSRAIVMSGLPGAGKDSYATTHFGHLPMVSLDRLRQRMGVDPEDTQGRVVQAAFEQARGYLRAGSDFVWNATCVTRLMRRKVVALCLDYGASVEIHCQTVPLDVVLERNGKRDQPVPEHVIRKLAGRREPVGLDEAHCIFHNGRRLSSTLVAGTGEEDRDMASNPGSATHEMAEPPSP